MIRAVIFDLDGTVLDNEGVWEEAFREVAEAYSLKPTLKQPNGWWHEPGMGLVPNWMRVVLDPVKAEELAVLTRRKYREKVEGTEPRVMEGVAEVVEKVKERGWMTGLCTGSYWYVVEGELEQLGLHLAFDVTTTGEEVSRPKPDPEIYLLTAQKLSMEPEELLVIEDSLAGARSALEPGMQVIGLVSEYASRGAFEAVGVKFVVEKFSDVLAIINDIE